MKREIEDEVQGHSYVIQTLFDRYKRRVLIEKTQQKFIQKLLLSKDESPEVEKELARGKAVSDYKIIQMLKRQKQTDSYLWDVAEFIRKNEKITHLV